MSSYTDEFSEVDSRSQVALLHRISSIANTGVDLDRMLNELISLAVQVTDCDACLVYLLDRASREVVLRASQLPHAAEIGNIRMKIGDGITGWVAAHHSVVALSSNASSDARFKAFRALPEDDFEAFLSVPLISGDDLIGVLNVHHKEPHAHTAEEVALVSFVGEQMAGAITKLRLAQISRNALERMRALTAVAQVFSEENFHQRILQTISELLAQTTDAPACSIMMLDEERRELVVSAGHNASPDYQGTRLPVDKSLTGRAVLERRAIVTANVLEDSLYQQPDLARRTGLVSLLSVPLIARGKVIGAINVYTHEARAFSEDEIAFVNVIAGQAALALDNARLMNETLEMQRNLEQRKLVERAKGILQRRHNLTEEEAYLRLRNESRRLRRPMRELAEAIILAEDLHRRNAEVQ